MHSPLRRTLVLGGTASLLASCATAATHKRATKKTVALADDDAPDSVGYGSREDVMRFADAVAERRGLDATWLRKSLAQARFQPLVTRYIMPTAAGAAKNWNAYRARFVEPPADLEARAVLLAPDIVPTFTAAEMVERGAKLPDAALAVESLLALVELQNGDAAPTYVAGTSNFYALTRYNWSSYYAMAVLALGETVRPLAR